MAKRREYEFALSRSFVVLQAAPSHLISCTVGYSEPIEFLIDSGSDWSVVGEEDWRRLRDERKRGGVVLYGLKEKPGISAKAFASAKPVEAARTFHAWVEACGATKPRRFERFFVVEGGTKSILGREAAKAMELLLLGAEVQPHANVMEVDAADKPGTVQPRVEEFAAIPNFVMEFDVDTSVSPSVNAYVNIPEAYRDRAVERLRLMENQKIIEKVKEAPTWVSGMSAVPKGQNDFRLVVNMTGPNRAIRRRFYKMPSMESIKARLSGARYFTKLDLKSAFHHIRLGEKSKRMTTFLAPDGMYRFTRLNFGVNSAPEAFQQKMEEILQSIPNVVIYIDDVLVFARDRDELRTTTKFVLEALKENNLTLNEDKCEFGKERLEFLGHELSAEGFNIARKKVEDVEKFRAPKSSTETRSFLGLAGFLSGYIGNFADVAKPLWDVAVSGNFRWGREQQEAFEALKSAISGCTTKQGFFNGTDDVFLYTDASEWAIGSVLVQRSPKGDYRTIAFASKLLSPTERRYPQTQREALAIVWAVEHFWYYLTGRKFVIRTDAQGISFIFKNDVTQTKRIMRRADAWRLRLEGFDYSVEFVRGEENIADPSSRLLVEGDGPDFEDDQTPGEIGVFELTAPDDLTFPEGTVTIEEVRYHTSRDGELNGVAESLESGDWPRTLGKYKSVGAELRIMDGCVSRMGELVIPSSLRPKVLSIAHVGHPGALTMKSILRGSVWWPGVLTHVENWVRECEACVLTSRRNSPMPMQRSRLPGAVWDVVAMDFNGPYRQFGDVYILLIVDAYSRFLIARPVRNTDFASIRGVLDDVYDSYGNVKSCKSDNGPPFFGEEFKRYNEARGIGTVHSTPLDAQQNGGVETYMRLVGKAMTMPAIEGGNWRTHLAGTVAAHNAGICPTTGMAPEALMFGRKLRRNLPMLSTATRIRNDEEIRERDWREKLGKKAVMDAKRSAAYSTIGIGDKVFISRQGKLKGQSTFLPTKFTVIGKQHGTLELLSPLGNVMKRTITFVKKAPAERVEPDMARNQSDVDRGGSATAAGGDAADRPALDGPERGQGIEPRQSGRVRGRPVHLRDYICLLQWQLENELKLG